MSNKKILNKKYIFLQNLFYQSIPISFPENNQDNILNSLKKTRRVSGPSKGLRSPWGQNRGKAHKKILYPKDLSLLKLINPFLNNKKDPLSNVSLLTIKRTPPKMARTYLIAPILKEGVIKDVLKGAFLKGNKNKNLKKSSHKIGGDPDGHVFDDKTNLSYNPSISTWSYFCSFRSQDKKANKSFFKLRKKLDNPLNRGGLFLNWEKSIFQIQNIYYGPFITLKIGALLNGKANLNGASLKCHSFLGFAHKNPYIGLSKGSPLNQSKALNNHLKNAQLGWPSWENTANNEIKLQNTKDELKVSMGLRNITLEIGGGPLLNVFKKYLPLYFSTKKYIAKTMPESPSIFRLRDIGKAHGQFNKTLPYKKSFFCYWLLPFMGFVSCFPALPQETSFLNSPAALSTFNLWSSSKKDLENKAINPPGFSSIKYLKNPSIRKYSFRSPNKKENQVLDSIKKLYNFYYEDLEKSIKKSISEVSPPVSTAELFISKGGPHINNGPINPTLTNPLLKEGLAIKHKPGVYGSALLKKGGKAPVYGVDSLTPLFNPLGLKGAMVNKGIGAAMKELKLLPTPRFFKNKRGLSRALEGHFLKRGAGLQDKENIQLRLPRTQLLEKRRIISKEASFKATWFSSKLTIAPPLKGSYLTFNKANLFQPFGGHDFSDLWDLKNASPLIGLSGGLDRRSFAHTLKSSIFSLFQEVIDAGHYLKKVLFISRGRVPEGFYISRGQSLLKEPTSKNPPLFEMKEINELPRGLFISRGHGFRYNVVVFARKLEKDLYGTPQGGGRLTNLEFKKIAKTNGKVEPIILPFNITFKEIHNSRLLHFQKSTLFTRHIPPRLRGGKPKGSIFSFNPEGSPLLKEIFLSREARMPLRAFKRPLFQTLNPPLKGSPLLKGGGLEKGSFETWGSERTPFKMSKPIPLGPIIKGPIETRYIKGIGEGINNKDDPSISLKDHFKWGPFTLKGSCEQTLQLLNEACVAFFLECEDDFETPQNSNAISSFKKASMILDGLMGPSYEDPATKIVSKLDNWIKNAQPAISHYPLSRGNLNSVIYLEQNAKFRTPSNALTYPLNTGFKRVIKSTLSMHNLFSLCRSLKQEDATLYKHEKQIMGPKGTHNLAILKEAPNWGKAPLSGVENVSRMSLIENTIFFLTNKNNLAPFFKGVTGRVGIHLSNFAPHSFSYKAELLNITGATFKTLTNPLKRGTKIEDLQKLQTLLKRCVSPPTTMNPGKKAPIVKEGSSLEKAAPTRPLMYKLNKDSFYYFIFSGNIKPLEAFFDHSINQPRGLNDIFNYKVYNEIHPISMLFADDPPLEIQEGGSQDGPSIKHKPWVYGSALLKKGGKAPVYGVDSLTPLFNPQGLKGAGVKVGKVFGGKDVKMDSFRYMGDGVSPNEVYGKTKLPNQKVLSAFGHPSTGEKRPLKGRAYEKETITGLWAPPTRQRYINFILTFKDTFMAFLRPSTSLKNNFQKPAISREPPSVYGGGALEFQEKPSSMPKAKLSGFSPLLINKKNPLLNAPLLTIRGAAPPFKISRPIKGKASFMGFAHNNPIPTFNRQEGKDIFISRGVLLKGHRLWAKPSFPVYEGQPLTFLKKSEIKCSFFELVALKMKDKATINTKKKRLLLKKAKLIKLNNTETLWTNPFFFDPILKGGFNLKGIRQFVRSRVALVDHPIIKSPFQKEVGPRVLNYSFSYMLKFYRTNNIRSALKRGKNVQKYLKLDNFVGKNHSLCDCISSESHGFMGSIFLHKRGPHNNNQVRFTPDKAEKLLTSYLSTKKKSWDTIRGAKPPLEDFAFKENPPKNGEAHLKLSTEQIQVIDFKYLQIPIITPNLKKTFKEKPIIQTKNFGHLGIKLSRFYLRFFWDIHSPFSFDSNTWLEEKIGSGFVGHPIIKIKKGGTGRGPFVTPHQGPSIKGKAPLLRALGYTPGKDHRAINDDGAAIQHGCLAIRLIRQLSIFNLSPTLLMKNRFFIKKPHSNFQKKFNQPRGLNDGFQPPTDITDNALLKQTTVKTYKTNKKKDLPLKTPLEINMGDALTFNNFYKGSIGYSTFMNYLDFDPIIRPFLEINQKIELSKYISFLEKKKYAEKKHRKRKQDDETSQNQERKRWYPRPIWHRSQLYEKFIKLRHMPSKQSRFQVGFHRPLIWHPHFKESSMSGATPTNALISKRGAIEALDMAGLGSPFHFQEGLFKPGALLSHFKKGPQKIYRNYKAQNHLAYNNNKGYVPHDQPWPLWTPLPTLTPGGLRLVRALEPTRQPGGLYKQGGGFLGDLSQNFQVYRFNGNSSNYYGSIIGEKNLKMLSQLIMSYSHTKKNFYEISRPTLSELRKSFWKSYWLRSNLNPYLKRVKLYFKELRDTNVNTKKSLFLNYNIKSATKTLSLRKREIPLGVSPPKGEPFRAGLEGFSTSLKDNRFEILNSMPGNKWQIATNVRQYHLIVYERLQQIILNIRGNLGINGQPKPRAYKLGCRKLPTPKPIKEFWMKLGKAITFELPSNSLYGQSPYKVNFSGDISKLRRIWALNKSNLSHFKAINQRKNLWLTGKIRTQSQSNQTLKAIYKILPSIKPSNNRFQSIGASPCFAGEIGALAKGATPRLRDINRMDAGDIAPMGPDILNQLGDTLKEYIRSININQYKLRKKENKLAYLGFLTKKTNKLSLSALRDFKLRIAFNHLKSQKTLSFKTVTPLQPPFTGGGPFQEGHSFSYSVPMGFDILNGVLFKNRHIPPRLRGGKPKGSIISNRNSLAQLNLTFLNKFTTQYNYWWNLFPIKRIPDFSPPLYLKGGHQCPLGSFISRGSPSESHFFFKKKKEKIEPTRQILSSNVSHFALTPIKENNSTPPFKPFFSRGGGSVWASTFLFHLCAFLFLINSSEIRGLIKFQMIFFSIAMKIYLNIARKTSFWIKGVVEERGVDQPHTTTNIFGFHSSQTSLGAPLPTPRFFKRELARALGPTRKSFKEKIEPAFFGGNRPPLFKRPLFPLNPKGLEGKSLLKKETLRGTGMAGRKDYLNTLQTKTFFCKEILNGDLINRVPFKKKKSLKKMKKREGVLKRGRTGSDLNPKPKGLFHFFISPFFKDFKKEASLFLSFEAWTALIRASWGRGKGIGVYKTNTMIKKGAKPPVTPLGGGHTFFIGISANSKKGSTSKLTSVYRLSFKGHPFHTKIPLRALAQTYLSLLNIIIKSNLHETMKFFLRPYPAPSPPFYYSAFPKPPLLLLSAFTTQAPPEALKGSPLELRASPLGLKEKIEPLFQETLKVSKVITEVTKFILFSCYKMGAWFYVNLLKRFTGIFVNVFQNIVGFIYLFFEKPGELLGEWIGYGFLVDWSSDLITTIPESNDLLRMNISSKIARGVRPFIMGYYGVLLLSFYNLNQVCLWVPPLIQQPPFFLSFKGGYVFISFPLLMGSASLLNRRILHMYETILEKWWEPDTDLLIRQKKGMIFWDFWSEVLIDVAEDSNINISELSLLTEEQNRLLEKLEVYSATSHSQLRKQIVFQTGLFREEMVSSLLPGATFKKSPILFRKPYYFCLPPENRGFQTFTNPRKRGGRIKGSIFSLNPPLNGSPLALNGSPLALKGSPLGGGLRGGLEGLDLFSRGLLNFKRGEAPLLRAWGIGKDSFNFKDTLNKNKGGPVYENLTSVITPSNDLINPYKTKRKGFKKNPLLMNKNWSVNQFLSYQEKDTQLFIQKSPPKSFAHISAMKYSQSAHEPVGSAVCQIFSGIFNKQRAKNILVVGSSGTKNDALFIQSIAGETELKIIIDNAQRYSLVHSGVAIGIKLLKDVFEALSLHTPCIFLLEDIHHIGGRRPLLLSDQSTMPGGEFSLKAPLEIDEKNQVTSELSKHLVNDYKKPYKGDFSLLMPSNHFCFNLFLGASSAQIRPNQLEPVPSTGGHFKPSGSNSNIPGGGSEGDSMENHEKLPSSLLQIKSNDLLAPPATSPFSVLLLKEDQKLKNKHVVKEMPWGGFPSEKLALISKSNYSVRVKIALLTDLAVSNVAVKLDMITDLLVIIDSVKGTKGFIVFATTHVPYILDPALRRPGRFNETISLPLIPNLFGRWEILKTNLQHFIKPSFYSWAEPTRPSFSKGITFDLTKSISTTRVPVFISRGGDPILDSNQVLAANLAFRKNSKKIGRVLISGPSPKGLHNPMRTIITQGVIKLSNPPPMPFRAGGGLFKGAHNKLTFNYHLKNHAPFPGENPYSKPIIDPFQIKKNIQKRDANLYEHGRHTLKNTGVSTTGFTPKTMIPPIQEGGGSGFDISNGVQPPLEMKYTGLKTLFNKDSILSFIKMQLISRGGAYITSTPRLRVKDKHPSILGAEPTRQKSIALATQTNRASTLTTGPLLKKAPKIQNAPILLTVIARAYFSGSQIITSFNSLPKSDQPQLPYQGHWARHIKCNSSTSFKNRFIPAHKRVSLEIQEEGGVLLSIHPPFEIRGAKSPGLTNKNHPLLNEFNRDLSLTNKKSNFIIDQPHKLMSSTDSILLNSNIYLNLYASPETLKNYLTNLIAGKLGELFISSASGFVPSYKQTPSMGLAHAKYDSNNFKGNSGLMNLYGIDKSSSDSWTSLLFSIITQRYLSNKNLSISKLLYFSNYSALNGTPAFPTSNILLPLKRYENYRKTFYTQIFENKINFQGKTLQEILELHQQQRFVKRLYKLPLREFFRSEVINNKLTGFANSFITLSAVEKNINCSTNINWYYRNRILNRHRNYLKNQWCNGQLIEHNIESTFLSDIDWRSQCVDSIGDIFIDFPDSDQFYNVQNRRWMLTSTSCQNWSSFEKTNYNATINQYMFDCLIKALHSLDQSREILDFYAFSSFHECMLKDLKEITTISLFKRFYRPL